jgi:hypothetical protein
MEAEEEKDISQTMEKQGHLLRVHHGQLMQLG